jgi:hypothetical protein
VSPNWPVRAARVRGMPEGEATTDRRPGDEQAAEEFAGRLFELFIGVMMTYLIGIGRRTGNLEDNIDNPWPHSLTP